MESGAAHHTVMTNAIGVDIFRMFAQMAHTELAVIDKSTDVASFKNELRWNKAYFQLAQGL